MSANITIRKDGSAEMFSVGDTPWHGLGAKLDQYATSAEAMTAAQLDWRVGLTPVQYVHEGRQMTLKDRFVVRRLDNGFGLGTVGPNWTPLQPNVGFSFMDAVIGEKAAVFETAGSLAGGKRVWMLARTDNLLRVGTSGDDTIKPYFLCYMGFDGKVAVNFRLCTTRTVCQNTLTIAMAEAGAIVRLRHTKDIVQRVGEVRERLGVINKSLSELNEQFNAMAAKQCDTKKLGVFLDTLGFDTDSEEKGKKEKALKLVDAFENSAGAKLPSARGTMWGALNAVTFYVDHMGNLKEGKDGQQKHFANTMFGSGNLLKERAFDLALAMSK